MTTNIFLYIVLYIVLYKTMYNNNIYFSLYTFLLMKNKYCYYTSSCMTRYTLSCTRKIFVVII